MPSVSDWVERFSQQKILVVGDIMLDWFIWGSVSRISPEAPVPVVEVQKEDRYPGGAANVSRNIIPFGAKVELSGLYGHDPNGMLLSETLASNGIGSSLCLRVDHFQTITKTRVVARHQQVVRIDREKRFVLSADLEASLLEKIIPVVPNCDALIIEDYGKGLITQSLIDGLVAAARSEEKIITVDPNPHNPINWEGVTTVKPNRSEAFACAGITDLHRDQLLAPLEDAPLLEAGQRLLEKWKCQQVLLTLGEQGMLLFSGGPPPLLIPAHPREVFDVSGAGDTAIAIYTLALCAGFPPGEAARLSNLASSIVVSKLGTSPIEKNELVAAANQEL